MLSQHSLNKGRSKRLVSAVAALSLFFGAAHVAPTASAQEIGAKFSIDEDEHGYRIASGSTNHQIRTELFSATAQAGGEKRLAYCTEWEVNFQKTNDAYAAKWSDFPGKNKFKDDETVRQKINWIAANSYPAVSYETVLQKAGVNSAQVSVKSVIAQTQAAIWNLGSGFDYKGLAQGEGTAEEQQNAKKVYEYLLGPANVGRAESTSVDLQVGFKGKDTAKRQANGTFGPFTLDTNADSVEVTAETGQVVDKDGKPFPANEIKNGQEFYFKAEEQAGSAKLIAKAASSEVNGALIISPKQGGNGHHQTLIVTHDKSKTKEAELYIEWEGTNARLSTTARKKGDEHSQRVKSKGGTIVDIVAYEGLIVGKEYTLKGQLYERVKQDDGTYKGVATDIKAEKKFTPVQAKDEVHLELEIPEGYAGKTLVVFEEAYGPDGKLIAKHDDINDENQTIYVNQPYQDMSSDSSAAKTGSAGAMFAGSSKCFSGGAAGGSSKKEDKNKGSLGDLFAGSSSLFGGDKDKDKGGSDSNGGSTNGGNGNGNGGSNTNGGSTGDNKDNNGSTSGSTGGGNGNGGGNGGANGGSDTKTGSDAGAVAGSAGGALTGSSSDKDKDKKGSTTGSSGDNKGNGNGQGNGGSDGKSGFDINSTSDTNGGSTSGSSGEGKGKGQGNGTGQGNGNGGSTAGSSGEGKGQGNGGANGGSDTQNGSDSENKNGSAALAGSTSGADCGGALALGALAVGGLVLTAVGFNVLAKNAAPAPLAGAADPKSDTKGAAPAAGDPNNKNATNSNTKGVEPKEKGVAHKDPNTSKMDVKSASPAKSNSALANTGVSGILIMLAIAAVAAVAGGALIFFGRRKKN
ncbi:VaFE repeat-containing surface-anchored protein [Corynebacterium matruchotii]|uniref:VaFE repeat-containing surface-anchored protein n=1 Tax=Corynebacterium matruchotii TaxID=43768 RepID=UPI0028D31DCB|nr:VaFE repeat-containing surface-anchored protein [Corynebacterium matruchotii]